MSQWMGCSGGLPMLGSRQPAQAYRLSVGPIVKQKASGLPQNLERPLENYRNGLHLLGTPLGRFVLVGAE